MNTAKRINQIRNTSGVPVWQRNYYEHIIRTENEFDRIHKYIVGNPLRWQFDTENPDHRCTDRTALTLGKAMADRGTLDKAAK